MKIAMLSHTYPPMISGAALFAGRLAEALAKHGHDVLVITASEQGKPHQTCCGHLTVMRLSSVPNPFRVGQRNLLWPQQQTLSALHDFAPDILHVHDAFQLVYFALTYARKNRSPCIATLHGLPSLVSVHLPQRIRPIVEQALWRYATKLLHHFDAAVAPSETAAREFESHTRLHPKVISCGIDLEQFNHLALSSIQQTVLRYELGVPSGVPILLHVGRLDPEKNVEDVVRAAAHVINSTSAHLLVIGDGIARPSLENLCRELGIQQYCHFPGYVTDSGRLADIYRLANVFFTASCIETQGLVLLEAAACGLPIVAASCGAVPELIAHGVNGFLVAPDDTGAMAESILNILRNPNLEYKMRQASRRMSLPHDFQKTVNAYESFYLLVTKQSEVVTTQNAERHALHI